MDRPTKTLRDVIEAAKAAPDQWSYASAGGVGSSHHVAGELLNLRAGTNIQQRDPENGCRAGHGLGAETIGGSAEQWGKVYSEEQRKWTALVKQLNIPLQ